MAASSPRAQHALARSIADAVSLSAPAGAVAGRTLRRISVASAPRDAGSRALCLASQLASAPYATSAP